MFPSNNEKKVSGKNVQEWFVIIDNQQAGPYSLAELKRNPRFNPDTLVWKRDFQEWIKARFVPEMQEVFKDEPEAKALHEPDKDQSLESELGQQNQATLTLQQDPFPYQLLLWFLFCLLIIFYTFFQLYYNF